MKNRGEKCRICTNTVYLIQNRNVTVDEHRFIIIYEIINLLISFFLSPTGRRGSLKGVPMMTISESENWEISSCSGMKYGQFVDWEKIDPESSERYQRILKSDHQELKTMGRSGFWAMPHTLRAKAYYHIIHGINCRSIKPDRDRYQDVAKVLFGEQKMSTHPFPEYMDDGVIPRY